jgi:hypothetical protein
LKGKTTFLEDIKVFGKVRMLTLSAMFVAMSVVIGIVCKNFLTYIYYRITLKTCRSFLPASCSGPLPAPLSGSARTP